MFLTVRTLSEAIVTIKVTEEVARSRVRELVRSRQIPSVFGR
jgi:hypothetical protein